MTYENAGNPGTESNGKPNFGGCSTTPEWNIAAKDTIFKTVTSKNILFIIVRT